MAPRVHLDLKHLVNFVSDDHHCGTGVDCTCVACAYLASAIICIQGDSDAQVTLDDQQKINKFARHNAKLQDIKEELKQKKVLHQYGQGFLSVQLCKSLVMFFSVSLSDSVAEQHFQPQH